MSYDAECYCKDLPASEQCVFCEMEIQGRLRTLAHNIAWGAALCRADRIGYRRCTAIDANGTEDPHAWKPGCGKAAP